MKTTFVSRFRTRMSYEELEGLLSANCKGPYAISFEGVDEARGRICKVMRVAYQSMDDREHMREVFKASAA
jgi:hypothetical protein